MENQSKYVYLYDREKKMELFGLISKERTYVKSKDAVRSAAKAMISNSSEEYYLLEIQKHMPLGALLSDAISVDFKQIKKHMEKTGWTPEQRVYSLDVAQFPVNAQFLIPHCSLITEKGRQGLGKDGPIVMKAAVWENVKALHQIKAFVETCIQYPQLFTLGQFRRFLNITEIYNKFPKSLGFFTAIEGLPQNQYLMAYGFDSIVNIPKDSKISDPERINGEMARAIPYDKTIGYNLDANVEAFEVSGLADTVLISLFHLIQERNIVKKCGNCGKFFVPLLRSDAIYCDRPAPQDALKTCKEYGSKVLWYENVVSDEALKLARNIYYAKKMLAKRNPDKPEYTEMFEYYKVERKKWEAEVRAGTKTREAFVAWLNQMKKQRTLQ